MARTPKARKGSGNPTLWSQAEEVPRAGIPSTEKLSRRMRRYRIVVWAAVATFPLVGLSMFVMAGQLSAASGAEHGAPEVDRQGRAVAMTAVESWLDADPEPLPGGVLVSWDGHEVLPAKVVDPTAGGGQEVSAELATHSMTVRDGAGSMLRVDVLVGTSAVGEVSVLGEPTVLPLAPSSDWAQGLSPWPNNTPTGASEQVSAAVQAWAEAFTSGDPARLALTVGDADATHAYVPLSGVKDTRVAVLGAAWGGDGTGQNPGEVIVQAELTLVWPGQGDPERTGKQPRATVYDLLVVGADGNAPRVVAWGGAGTGPVLTPFVNAVVGRQLKAADPSGAAEEADTDEDTDTGEGAGQEGDQ